MACDLAVGYKEPCNDRSGGIRALYFINYGDKGSSIVSGVSITDFASEDLSAYKFDLKQSAEIVVNDVVSRENGTTVFGATITLDLKGLNSYNADLVRLFAYGRPHIVAEDMQGNAFMLGDEQGCDTTTIGGGLGRNLGDQNKYTVTFEMKEANPIYTLTGSVKGDPFNGLTASTVTIVQQA